MADRLLVKEKLTHASALLKAGYSTARAAKAAGIGRATLCRRLSASIAAKPIDRFLPHYLLGRICLGVPEPLNPSDFEATYD